ncbi:MAG: Na+/H+ antiporter NhaA [Candidatus Nanopelagicales bacterium]
MPEVLFERPELSERNWLLRVLRLETVGGILMLAAALVAIIWANTSASAGYFALVDTELGPGAWGLRLTLGEWASDFLLAFFFFLAGIELKHEITHGTLSKPSQAAVPVVAAICGMVVPVGIYLLFAGTGARAAGWGIPMATDIAFALAVLAIMGRGLPLALRAFLLTLAVVDDLGAILVIAIFYGHGFRPVSFGLGLLAMLVWWLLQARQVHGRAALLLAHIPLALVCWFLIHASGVHATVAGVALGLLTQGTAGPGRVSSPAERAEHMLRPFVAGVAVPLFAFTAAGVSLRSVSFAEAATSPVTLGVGLGLLLGKPIGVIGGSYLMARFTRATLNQALSWADVVAVGFLAGIGFTVSLLVAELAFEESRTHLLEAKLGIILATSLASLISALLLRRRRAAMMAYNQAEELDADQDGIPDVYQG